MTVKRLQASVEAILFSSGEPISLERIAQTLELEEKTVKKILDSLIDKFAAEESGMHILNFERKYQLCSKPEYGEYVRKAMNIKRNVPLSAAAMEVLAIVAYNQPVTKSFIEQIRGVDCSGVIASLSSKALIEERGRLELPGRPLLYGITENFLRCFGIENVAELPPVVHKGEGECEGG